MATSSGTIPTRHRVPPRLPARDREKAKRLGRYLTAGDPLADAVVESFASLPPGKGKALFEKALEHGIRAVPRAPAALKALFAEIDVVPFWVDWESMTTGGNAFLRSGMFGALVMACRSLPMCYASPSGNKPLVFSGNLVKQASPRLADTGRFIVETCKPGGLARFGEGTKLSLRVRIKHAENRRRLLAEPGWRAREWGVPINQSDLAATNLMFSVATLDGLRELGFRFSRDEAQGFIQLWRYSGHLIGIDAELLCATEDEARRLAELVLGTQGEPDDDSRRLIRSLMEDGFHSAFLQRHRVGRILPSELARQLLYGLSGNLVGDELARALGYPRSPLGRVTVPASRALVSLLELGRSVVPGGTAAMTTLGTRMIEGLVREARGPVITPR